MQTYQVVFTFTDDPATYEVPVVTDSREAAEEMAREFVSNYDFGYEAADLRVLSVRG